jgi:hypothetical protein
MTEDEQLATATLETGIRDQRLVVEGWIASHADSGTPGPHVHLRTDFKRDAVLRTDQVPGFVAALTRVADRIDQQWADGAGDGYPFGPDRNDPAVIRQERIADLQFVDGLHAHFRDVATMLLEVDDASVPIAEALGMDALEVSHRLGQVPLRAFTRGATEARARELRTLLAE